VPPPKLKASDLVHKSIDASLHGSRLAAHLIEVRDRFGASDPALRKMATDALARLDRTDYKGRDPFTAIRDRLLVHGNEARDNLHSDRDPQKNPIEYRDRARELATSYNWHRVGHALHVQDAVAEYLDKVAKDHIKGSHHRAAYEIFGREHPEGTPLADDQGRRQGGLREAFWAGLREHVNRRVGTHKDAYVNTPAAARTDAFLQDAMARLANQEGMRADLTGRGRKQLLESRGPLASEKAAGADYLPWLPGGGAAWRTDGGAKAGVRVNPGLSPEQYAKRSQHPEDLPAQEKSGADRRRITIDPRTGDEPGVNMWTGNKLPSSGKRVVAEADPDRHHWSDGIVHPGVHPGTNNAAPTADAAWHERVAVHRAMEYLNGGKPVPPAEVTRHVRAIKELAGREGGRNLFGAALDRYTTSAGYLADSLPPADGSLRGSGPDSRPKGRRVDLLTNVVTPLVRTTNKLLADGGMATPLAGERPFEVVPDEVTPADFHLPTPDDVRGLLDGYLARRTAKRGKLKLRDGMPKTKPRQGVDADPAAPAPAKDVRLTRKRNLPPLPKPPGTERGGGEPLGLPEHFARSLAAALTNTKGDARAAV
jgi:hypothetical protein